MQYAASVVVIINSHHYVHNSHSLVQTQMGKEEMVYQELLIQLVYSGISVHLLNSMHNYLCT